MAEILEYECPCCGGKVEFNSNTQQMQCPYCDSTFTIEALKEMESANTSVQEDNMNWNNPEGTWSEGETDGIKVYSCQSCGGEIMADETLGASKCPYCDNPIVLKGQFSDGLKPDCIIPFKLDKEMAKKKYLAHISGKKLLPPSFKDQNHIDEIKGVYVPVWLFDANAKADLRFKAEKEKRWKDQKFEYKEISTYSAIRKGNVKYENVPVDGSTKMDQALLESIEPFNMKDSVAFETAYLSGYLADKYDISAEDSVETANNRIKKSTEIAFRDTVVGYNTVNYDGGSICLDDAKTKYALYPVWILNTTWNGKKYTFAMNGQTGKFVGNLPSDKGLVQKYFFKWFFIGAIICFIIGLLLF